MPSDSEKFVVKNMFEWYIQDDDNPGNASLLEKIDSNIGKVVSQNKELQRELSELPKKHDMEEIQEKHIQKALRDEIKSLKKHLKDQEAIHMENSQNLKLLQGNIHHQNKVLFSVHVLASFIVAILVLCFIYNIPIIVAILVTFIYLYFLIGYITVSSLVTWLYHFFKHLK